MKVFRNHGRGRRGKGDTPLPLSSAPLARTSVRAWISWPLIRLPGGQVLRAEGHSHDLDRPRDGPGLVIDGPQGPKVQDLTGQVYDLALSPEGELLLAHSLWEAWGQKRRRVPPRGWLVSPSLWEVKSLPKEEK